MTNPKPSLFQCLVLHAIFDGEVFFEGEMFEGGDWKAWMEGGRRYVNVTKQMGKLLDDGYVKIMVEFPGLEAKLTEKGKDVVARRPLPDLMEQLARRQA